MLHLSMYKDSHKVDASFNNPLKILEPQHIYKAVAMTPKIDHVDPMTSLISLSEASY